MAKKQQQHNTCSLRSMSREQLEQFAVKSLAEGKLRMARDAYKELVRIDRDRFLPQLLRCYNMLAGKMAANGQMEEARNMIAYIKELGGEKAVTVNSDLFSCNGKTVDSSIFTLLELSRSGEEIPRELKYRAADAMIAADELPDGISESMLADGTVVMKALQAVCDGEFEKAAEALRPISYDSIFSQWKLLLRGMCCYYVGNDGKAMAAFERIAPHTVPARCARVFSTAVDHEKYLTKKDTDREDVLGDLCVITGHRKWAEVLPRAQYLWMTNRHRDSMLHVMKTVPGFPSMDNDLTGTLTNFYFNSIHHLDNKQADRIFELLERFFERHDRYSIPHLLAQRAMCIKSGFCTGISEDELIEMWELFMSMHRKIFGPDNELDAEIYLFTGMHLSAENSPDNMFDPFFSGKKRPSSSAEKCLKKAVMLSKSRDAYLALVSYYRLVNRGKECRRIVEDAVKAFPLDKELLREAGVMALNRNAVYKGVEYLDRAFQLDSIDPALREALSVGCINAARAASKNSGGVGKMRQYIEKAENLCTGAAGGFNGELCYIVMRRAAFEFFMGNEKEGREQLDRAYATAADVTMLTFFGYIMFKIYGVSQGVATRLNTEVPKWFNAPPVIDRAVALVKVLTYIRLFKDTSKVNSEKGRCIDYCVGAMKTGTFTEPDVRLFFEYAAGLNDMKNARKIVTGALAADPRNPLYRYFDSRTKLVEQKYIPPYKLKRELKKLRVILDDAKKSGDGDIAAMVNREISRVESLLHGLFPFNLPPMPPDDFDDLPEWFDPEYDMDCIPRRTKPNKKNKTSRRTPVTYGTDEQMDLFGGKKV